MKDFSCLLIWPAALVSGGTVPEQAENTSSYTPLVLPEWLPVTMAHC